jgi:hypothetical protein
MSVVYQFEIPPLPDSALPRPSMIDRLNEIKLTHYPELTAPDSS